jgi:PadR family transcriptional regulator PadR
MAIQEGNKMKLLSSHDEIFLLTILKLEDDAYGMNIRREVSKATEKNWSIGAIYDPLYRMEKRGLLESYLSDPTNERGGRSKRIFRVKKKGIEALLAHKETREKLWQGVKKTALNSIS